MDGIANYQFAISSRFMQQPANQMLLARAKQLNPSLNMPQYEQNKKFLTDMGASTPTSAGGAITAAKAAINHIAELSTISDKLPSNMGAVNAATNAFHSFTNTGDATALKDWNTAKDLAVGEIQKMIKGGIATEGETKQMIANLSANDPNRDAALATLAKFMVDKIQAQEGRRDQILGNLSPGTSFLNQQE